MTIMTLRPWHSGSLNILLGSILLLAPACGDDSGEEGTSEAETSSTVGSTGEGTTESPETTTGEDASGGGTTTGPGGESTSTGPGADSSGTAGSETGVPGECTEAMDQKTCETIEGCVWLGNMANGECLSDDASVCRMLMEMQACNQHPACEWNMQDEVCNPA